MRVIQELCAIFAIFLSKISSKYKGYFRKKCGKEINEIIAEC